MWPVLFRVGSLEVHSYGVMLMLAFIAGILLSRRQARRAGLSPDMPVDLGVWILIASIVLARLVYVALNWPDYAGHPATIAKVWQEGGLSFYGGLLGGVLAAAAYAWRTRLSAWTVTDVMTPGLALGYAIARVGCFLNGCCYGGPTSLPWAVSFPLLPEAKITTEPSHPTQLYSSLGSLIILGILLRLQPRLKARGQLFAVYVMLYAVLRSIVEVFRRGYSAQTLFDSVTQAQAASAVLFVAAVVAFVVLGRAGRPVPAAPVRAEAAAQSGQH
jgi:phosphatidylglycerol:prolipoprotein diacylglycerol transferase